MRKLSEIASDIRARLADDFQTVRVSSAAIDSQLLAEVNSINKAKLPAVIVVLDTCSYTDSQRIRAPAVTLVLVDSFRANAEDRVIGVWDKLETLATLYPADGVEVEGVFYLPETFYAAPVDKEYACYALKLNLQQRT